MRKAVRAMGMFVVFVIATGLVGCQKAGAITKEEESQFRNAPREMPPEAKQRMQEMMSKGKGKAETPSRGN